MAISEMQRNIILGQSQNQAIELIKIGLQSGELNLIAFLESEQFSHLYDRTVEILFKKNIDQQTKIGSNLSLTYKDSEPVKTDAKQTTASPTKPCPNCQKPMPSTWKFHAECGWKGN